MKFTTQAQEFRTAVAALSGLPGGVASHPGTLAVYLTADLDGLTLRRSTSIAQAEITLATEIEAEGRMALDQASLESLLKEMKGDLVCSATPDTRLQIQSKSATAVISGIVESGWLAPIEITEEGSIITMTLAQLLDTIHTIAPAVHKDAKSHPTRTGMLIRSRGESTMIAGTDGRRFHFCFAPASDSPKPIDALVYGYEAIERCLPSGGSDKASLHIGHGWITAHSGDAKISLRLAEQTMESVEVLFGFDETVLATNVDSDALLSAVRAASPFGISEGRLISLRFIEDKIEVEGNNNTISFTQAVPAKCAKASLNFNSRYLADLLSVIPKGEITLNLLNGVNGLSYRDSSKFLLLAGVRNAQTNEQKP